MSPPPTLEARGLTRRYRQAGRTITAVEDISFALDGARTLAVIGESGAGKSTLARMLCGLEKPTVGSVLIGGVPLQLRAGRPSPVQMVFQNPVDALSPFRSIERSMFEALSKSGSRDREARMRELLESVGLDPSRSHEKPRAFSGGQLQRIVVARALAAEPQVLLCDEPTSALDVSVQAQVVNLLLKLQEEMRLPLVLVTHDLAVARVLAHHILVLRDGRAVEQASAESFFARPSSEYARTLLASTETRPSDHGRGSAALRTRAR